MNRNHYSLYESFDKWYPELEEYLHSYLWIPRVYHANESSNQRYSLIAEAWLLSCCGFNLARKWQKKGKITQKIHWYNESHYLLPCRKSFPNLSDPLMKFAELAQWHQKSNQYKAVERKNSRLRSKTTNVAFKQMNSAWNEGSIHSWSEKSVPLCVGHILYTRKPHLFTDYVVHPHALLKKKTI